MSRYLSDSTTTELMSVLSSTYVIAVGDGTAELVTTTLPGSAVCAIQEIDGVLYVIVDLEKPLAHRHARQMIREWRERQIAAAHSEDVPINLVPVTPEPTGPCALSLVS